ncbi:MAG: hypothetical protein ABR520_02380 [Mycobacteriales bacterium]|nr:hypothetical protein [Frankia sp.]
MTVVLVYSNDGTLRERVRQAIGRYPAAGVDNLSYLESSTGDEVIRAVDRGLADLLILDGEAWPTGGMGLSRELKNSAAPCPPVIVLLGRPDDRWLAKWSQADAALVQPVDPVELVAAVVDLLRGRAAATAEADLVAANREPV